MLSAAEGSGGGGEMERWVTDPCGFLPVRPDLSGNTTGMEAKPRPLEMFYPLCKHSGALFKSIRKQETASGVGQQKRNTEDYSSEHSKPCSIPCTSLPGADAADPLPCWEMSSDRLSNEMSSCSSRKIRPCAQRLMLAPSPKQGKAARGFLQGIMLCGD